MERTIEILQTLGITPNPLAGNCGVIAIVLALQHPEGEFILWEPIGETERISHVAYQKNGQLWDINGRTTAQNIEAQLDPTLGKHQRISLPATPTFHRYILKGTSPDTTVGELHRKLQEKRTEHRSFQDRQTTQQSQKPSVMLNLTTTKGETIQLDPRDISWIEDHSNNTAVIMTKETLQKLHVHGNTESILSQTTKSLETGKEASKKRHESTKN